MMSLIVRAPSTLLSSASESRGKKSYGSQSPWSVKAEKDDRTGQPVVDRDASHESVHHHKQFVESSYSARYSGWDDGKAWSSQEWKADELMDDGMETPVVCSRARTHEFQTRFSREHKHVIIEEENHDRTGTPVVCPQRRARTQQYIIGDDDHPDTSWKGEWSSAKKTKKRSSMSVTENDEKHSVKWWMFMSVTLESAVFMEKHYSDNCNSIYSIKNTQNLTMKRMFDISANFVSEQDEIYGVKTIDW